MKLYTGNEFLNHVLENYGKIVGHLNFSVNKGLLERISKQTSKLLHHT